MQGFLVTLSYYIHEILNGTVFQLLGVIIVLFFILNKEWYYLKTFLVGLVGTSAVIFGLKNLLQIPRPLDGYIIETGYGMPSGHAGLSFFLATFFIYYIVRLPENKITETISWMIILLTAIAIGASRVILRVHTLEQVIFGALIGICVPVFIFLVTRKNN